MQWCSCQFGHQAGPVHLCTTKHRTSSLCGVRSYQIRIQRNLT
jgi:hypothetical protein